MHYKLNCKMKRIALLLCIVPMATLAWAQRRELVLKDWLFSRDNAHFEEVTVPHDWAISGPFDKKWDMQTVAIVQNGETKPSEITGRTGSPAMDRRWLLPLYFSLSAELSALCSVLMVP